MLARYRDGVVGKRVALNVVDIILKSVRQRKNERDAYYSDASRKGNEDRSRFFGKHVFKA